MYLRTLCFIITQPHRNHTILIPGILLVLVLHGKRTSYEMDKPSRLASALSALTAPYKSESYAWEFVETTKKLLLVGLARIFKRGSVTQLIAAILFSMMMLTIITLRRPYRDLLNNFLAIGANFAILAFLLLCAGSFCSGSATAREEWH